jgi:3-deoxy-manno-octulosonate cytidylyltransferase (CMP-KDO synthetase)
MTALGVIPARYGSTRLPAKPLLKIKGRPLLEWVIRGVQDAESLDELVVATDHPEIAKLAESLGVEAVITDPAIPSGSDRVWAAAQNRKVDIVLNIQGDEALIQPFWVDRLIGAMKERPEVEMATLGHELRPEHMQDLNTVKLILNQRQEAIYFSRYPIPYSREGADKWPNTAWKHIGLYGYRKEFLRKFCAQAPVPLEKAESLEQLRALWLGGRIHVTQVDVQSVEVNTPDDVAKVEKWMTDGGVK